MASQTTAKKHAPSRPRSAAPARAVPSALRRLERLFDEIDWPDRRAFLLTRRLARKHALEALAVGGDGADATSTWLLVAAVELFVGVGDQLAERSAEAARLGEQVEALAGVSRLALACDVLRAPELLTVSPARAVERQLTTLTALAPLRSASLWTLDDAERPQCTCHAGESRPSPAARQIAEHVLAGHDAERGSRRLLLALPVGRRRRPLAALVVTAKPGRGESCKPFLRAASGMLGAVLERDALLAASAASERALVDASERKLARLGFDLHDGPIQDVVVTAHDLRFLSERVQPLLGEKERTLARDTFDQIESQLMSLEGALRRISNEVRASSAQPNRPFASALREIAQTFATRTDVVPQLEIEGELGALSASQQIALLNIVQEALANVREHSNADRVRIAVSVGSEGVEAQVSDNGDGFDLEDALLRSARAGRLGLVAMRERVRLLGGQCRIESREGGPTVVSVRLERWSPLSQDG
jgi:signal transduction histidine kinase